MSDVWLRVAVVILAVLVFSLSISVLLLSRRVSFMEDFQDMVLKNGLRATGYFFGDDDDDDDE